MTVEAYLYYRGNCREAVEFYATIFGAEPKFMTYGEMPPDVDHPIPEASKHLILHADLPVGESILMFSDITDDMPYTRGNNIALTISGNDLAELRRQFDEMKQGGTVHVEFGKTFWSEGFGSVIDKYGIPWQFNHCAECAPK